MNRSTEAGAARKDGSTTTTITVRLCYQHHPHRLRHGPEHIYSIRLDAINILIIRKNKIEIMAYVSCFLIFFSFYLRFILFRTTSKTCSSLSCFYRTSTLYFGVNFFL